MRKGPGQRSEGLEDLDKVLERIWSPKIISYEAGERPGNHSPASKSQSMTKITIYNEDTGECILEFEAANVVFRGEELAIEVKPNTPPKLLAWFGGRSIDYKRSINEDYWTYGGEGPFSFLPKSERETFDEMTNNYISHWSAENEGEATGEIGVLLPVEVE